MSLKKNIGVLVLLLVLLSMSAVSAEDVSVDTNNTYQAPNEIQKDFTSLQTDIDNSQNVFELNMMSNMEMMKRIIMVFLLQRLL